MISASAASFGQNPTAFKPHERLQPETGERRIACRSNANRHWQLLCVGAHGPSLGGVRCGRLLSNLERRQKPDQPTYAMTANWAPPFQQNPDGPRPLRPKLVPLVRDRPGLASATYIDIRPLRVLQSGIAIGSCGSFARARVTGYREWCGPPASSPACNAPPRLRAFARALGRRRAKIVLETTKPLAGHRGGLSPNLAPKNCRWQS